MEMPSFLAVLCCVCGLTLAGCDAKSKAMKSPVRVKSAAQREIYEESMNAAASEFKSGGNSLPTKGSSN